MHISGLEVEGYRPRALMESAPVFLKQVIGLERPQFPWQVLDKPFSAFMPSIQSSLQSRRNSLFCT